MLSLRPIVVAALSVGALLACTQTPAVVTVTGTDAGEAGASPGTDAGDAGVTVVDGATDAEKPTGNCTRTLSLGEAALKLSAADCDLNENVARRKGVLTYGCGDGPAKADVGGKTFTGTINGDAVQLTLVDDFDYGACSFTSTETLSGSLAGGKLSYAYKEAYQASSPTTCGLPDCTATGTVNVVVGPEVKP